MGEKDRATNFERGVEDALLLLPSRATKVCAFQKIKITLRALLH